MMDNTAQTASQVVTRLVATAEQQRALGQMSLYPSRAEEITQIWKLTGPLDVERLEWAVGETVRAHDMLRARMVVEAESGAFLEVFEGYDGLDRRTTNGDLTQFDTAVGRALHEPLASRQRWFDAILLNFDADNHALIIRLHHALVDGYSIMLVEREIWDRYGDGEYLDQAEPVQYATLVRPDVDPEAERQAREWWTERLVDAWPVSARPSQNATGTRFEARDLPFALTREETERLREFARTHRTSLTSVLLAAHMMTIKTFSNDADVTTAIAYLNRDSPGLDSVVGPLVNLIPIRARLRHPSLAENIGCVSTALRKSVIHGHLPFDQIIASTGPASDRGFGIARTAFSMAPGPFRVEFQTSDGLHVKQVPAAVTETRIDFAFTCVEDGDRVRGALVYRADLYASDVAESILDYFSTTIRFAVMQSAESAATTHDHAIRRCEVAELLSFATFDTNDPIACDQKHGTVCRRDFEALVAAYSAAIPREALRPRVALALGSSVDQAAALVATWRRGGCAVLIDPRHPAERYATTLTTHPVDIFLDRPREPSADNAATVQIMEAATNDIAYVVSTSGTDGAPKSVAVTYGNLTHLLSMLAEVNAPVPSQNPLGPGFDGWIWGTLLPWISGKPVVYPARGAADVTALVHGEESSVTLTPTMLADCDPDRFPKTIISAGEPLTEVLAARFGRRSRIINAYGPTEATVCASWSDTARIEDPTTIGTPASGVTVHVLDMHLRPVPVGAVGEIYIGGPGVAHGYVGERGNTACRFVADSFGPTGGRLYRTGDLATVDSNGWLRFAGRNDDQVKVSGVRIELDEVAAALQNCAIVRESAAVAVVLDGTGTEIWAAVVLDESVSSVQDRSDDALFNAAYRKLLPEARPTRTFSVPVLPQTSNGKLDRARLQDVLKAAVAERALSMPGETGTRDRVASIWEQVLSVRIEDYDRTFFEYGGHSLAAARTIRILHREFGRTVPAFALYNHPTVNELSAWLDGDQ
ncbi:AMP-binding protein [Nocardia colli]|uniref:AMP-binding protein n=1 Tax=Nocardia colli TaxID=2545717 RepID=UPI0035D553B8